MSADVKAKRSRIDVKKENHPVYCSRQPLHTPDGRLVGWKKYDGQIFAAFFGLAGRRLSPGATEWFDGDFQRHFPNSNDARWGSEKIRHEWVSFAMFLFTS